MFFRYYSTIIIVVIILVGYVPRCRILILSIYSPNLFHYLDVSFKKNTVDLAMKRTKIYYRSDD